MIVDHIVTNILWEYYIPNLKLACFVLYLKMINTFVKMTFSKLSKELKNSIKV